MTMWEWRIFYSESEVPQWAFRIQEMLHKIPVEERTDLYYNLHSSEMGMKIRAYSEDYQLLEVKVLQETTGEFELWEKPIEQTIQLIGNESLLENIIFSLEKSTQHGIQIKKILEILNSGDFNEVEITKFRKKTSIGGISIESVMIECQNKRLMGTQLECHSPLMLNKYIQKTLAIPLTNYANTSYPRFLMGL
jgi:hypothetical protein